MSSLTRRAALGVLCSLAAGLSGCSALAGRSSPLQRSWHMAISDATPIVGTDAGLLIGSRSPFRDRPLVAGLDERTGELTWTVTVPKGKKSPIGAADGRAYAFSKAETVVAVDAATGETLWQRSIPAVDAADPGVVEFAPIPLGDRVVVPVSGTEDDVPDRLLGLARDGGETVFSHELGASLSGAPGAAGERVVAPMVDGRLVSVDRTGAVEWRLDVGAAMSAVATTARTAYVGSGTERLLAVDVPAGEVAWRGRLRNTVFSRPLVTDDRVYVGGADYVLRAFDLDSGTQVWRDELSNAATHGPMRVGDRLVTLVGGEHRVRGPSGTLPYSPTELYVHTLDGSRVRAVGLDGGLEGRSVRWATTANGGLYLGQTFGVTRVAPEAIRHA